MNAEQLKIKFFLFLLTKKIINMNRLGTNLGIKFCDNQKKKKEIRRRMKKICVNISDINRVRSINNFLLKNV